MTSTQVKTRKRPGAPKGNQNARKHGIFAAYLPETSEFESIPPEEGLKQDLLLLQGRLFNALKEYEQAVKKKDTVLMLKWDKSILNHLETITNLRLRLVESGQMKEEVWDTLEEAVRSANSRQKVRW
jgi:uncharacterized protein YjcR